MTVFANAFFYLALFNRRDFQHQRASDFAQSYRGRIITTEWVLVEVADAFAGVHARRLIRDKFQVLRDDVGTEIVPASSESFDHGLWLYNARPDKAWSLTDCISFVVMTDAGLTDGLTGDRHFEQAGFRALLAG